MTTFLTAGVVRRHPESSQIGNLGFEILGLWIVKKDNQLVKGKSVEPFTCLQHQGRIVTNRTQIGRLLQEAWNPIFARYPQGEGKAIDYHTSFSLVPGTYSSYSFPQLTLDDFHYILRKKLKTNTATGLDGWRPHELKNLPDCLLSALLDVFHLCEQVGHFPSFFFIRIPPLFQKV